MKVQSVELLLQNYFVLNWPDSIIPIFYSSFCLFSFKLCSLFPGNIGRSKPGLVRPRLLQQGEKIMGRS
jgi:hypothetical protein